MDCSNFDFCNLGFLARANLKKSFRDQSFVPPGGTKNVDLILGSVHFDFYIESYICALAFGRIAQIPIPILRCRSDSLIRIGLIFGFFKETVVSNIFLL